MCAIEYYTYEDYKLWKGDWELIFGHPVAMSPAPVINHQVLMVAIVSQFYSQLEECKECIALAEEDWKISDETVVRPDVVVVCKNKTDNYITKAPEIVVEIVSPSTAKRDEKVKFELYEEEKVKYYILVYPEDKKAKIYKLEGKSFEKEGDFLEESYKFDDTTCPIILDFKKVFKKIQG